MALPPILAQVMAQAGKVYSECMAQRHPANPDGLLYLMSTSFTEFASKLDELYTDLETSLDYFEDQVVSLFDANINPMYLHLHAAVPAMGTGNWVQAIPNQNNSLGFSGHITGKGRFHCIGLTGSYASTTNKMRVSQCNGDKVPTNEEEIYIFPLTKRHPTYLWWVTRELLERIRLDFYHESVSALSPVWQVLPF